MKTYAVTRIERRVPMAVAVRIAGHPRQPGTETTFTENVSSRGARVLSVRRWQTNDRLELDLLAGGFRTPARVAYCTPVQDAGYAVGLEFLEPSGPWVVAPEQNADPGSGWPHAPHS
jgi:hypothetical protein